MTDDNVKQDVFNETMKRIEAMMAASEAKHEKIAAQMQIDFERAKHQYEIDSAKRDEHYNFLQDTYMQELKHIREYVDAKFFRFEFLFALVSFLFLIFEFFKR